MNWRICTIENLARIRNERDTNGDAENDCHLHRDEVGSQRRGTAVLDAKVDRTMARGTVALSVAKALKGKPKHAAK